MDVFSNLDTNMTEMDGFNPFKGKAPENPDFFPYGKPGGGAPMTDNKGRVNVQRHKVDFAREHDSSAEISRRKKAADEYLHELSECFLSAREPDYNYLLSQRFSLAAIMLRVRF